MGEEPMASSRSTKRHRSGHPLKAGPAEVLVEASAQNTHSNVDVGKHNDETDPTGLPTAALAQRPAGDAAPRLASAVAGAPPLAAAEPEDAPPLKRHRTARAKIPAALPPDALRVTDRLSGPVWADSNEGHYMYNVGDNLTPRFKVMRKFGEGTFGRVVECWDRRRSGYVAIKVVRNVEKYRDAAMVELQVLATLAANDPEQRYPIVRFLEWFDYRGHVCMVFERLGPSIYDCLRRNSYKPFPLPMALSFMRQVLSAVDYMHSLSLVHTDLKPENILLTDESTVVVAHPPGSNLGRKLPTKSDVRLIDFGSAAFDEDYHSSIVSTRHYRAPEIVLGFGWSKPCDMWSLGCIFVELLTGDALFQTHENLEHLAMMQAVLGPMPKEMAARASEGPFQVRSLFRRGPRTPARLNWPEGAEGKKSLRAVAKMETIQKHLATRCDESVQPYVGAITAVLLRMMAWDAKERCTAREALDSPLLSEPHIA